MEKLKERRSVKEVFGEFMQGLKELGHSFASSEDNTDEKTLNEAPANIRAEFAKAYAAIEKDENPKKTDKKRRIEINTKRAVDRANSKAKEIGERDDR